MTDRLDIVVFGATGLAGQYAVENIVKTIDQENAGLTFGIAGRSERKLRDILDKVSGYVGKRLDDVPIIVANVDDEPSILAMCGRAKVILNCVGPYHLWGEVVVKSCVATKTHHLDLSGETNFLETMQIKYNDKARDAGIFIVGAAGYDSVPVDLGILYLKEHFDGELAWAESYCKVKAGTHGATVNHGTYDSAVTAVGNWRLIFEVRKLLESTYSKPLPDYKHKLKFKLIPHSPPAGTVKLAIPFMDTDRTVANRTSWYNYIEHQERPVQVFNYVAIASWFHAILAAFVGAIFLGVAQFECGRRFLRNNVDTITFGAFSKNGPTREQVKGASFALYLVGTGWNRKLPSPESEPDESPSYQVVAKISGPEIAYDSTTIFMVQAAVSLLKDRAAIPFKGGVLTPGLTFRKTAYLDRLQRHSIKFEIVK